MQDLIPNPESRIHPAYMWWVGLSEAWRKIYERLFLYDISAAYRYFGQPDSPISFFVEQKFLSNFHTCSVEYDGLFYTSSEAAYQSAKTEDMETRGLFTLMSPSISKKEGQRLVLRPDWNETKDDVMYQVLKSKFELNPSLAMKLKETEDRKLEETNWWGDKYWGVCNGEGENRLGEILMKIREEMK